LKPTYVTVSIIAASIILLLTPLGRTAVMYLFCFLIPAYKSYKAKESKEADDDGKWLTYWIVVSFFFAADDLIRKILFFVPYWGIVRIVVMILLYNPTSDGAGLIYSKILKPILSKYETQIDSLLNKAESKLQEGSKKVKDMVIDKTVEHLKKN
jgi:receptor expression-enhancing protein 5/6